MNKRQNNLLIALLQQESFQTLKFYAATLSVSERTLQSDLKVIDEYLKTQCLKLFIERKKGIGIRLVANNIERTQLLKDIGFVTDNNNEEDFLRKQELIFYLVIGKSPQSIEELIERLYISKQLLKKDLKAIEPTIQRFGLELISKTRVGTYIAGDERNKRELLATTLKNIRQNNLNDVLLEDFLGKDTLLVIQHILEEVFQKFDFVYDTNNFSIDVHVYFMLERMKQGETVQLTEEERVHIQNSLAQKMSGSIIGLLSKIYPIKFFPDEIDYLACRINGVINADLSGKTTNDIYTDDVTDLIIHKVEQLMDVSLQDDFELKENLYNHLRSVYYRVKHGFSIANPLKKEIMTAYTQLFLIIQMVLEEVYADEKFLIPQEEIAYLTIHFQTAIERKKKQNLKSYKVVLLTQYTKSMATFFEARLQAEIPELVIVESMQIGTENVIPEDLDFIISTIPIESRNSVITISPMITEMDIANIKEWMLHNKPNCKTKKLDISKFVTPFLVFPQLEIENMENLLTMLGQNLVKHGYVQEEFITSLLQRELRSSTRVAPLISLPHGNPNFVNHSTISIATMKTPIDSQGESTQLILLLALRKEDIKTPSFRQIFSVVDFLKRSPQHLQRILQEKNQIELIKLLSEYE
ncbi:Transcriptional antiterminator [Pilibacter termitis]|uniref:Transcriptional antiterminator n=1 Tax=Pilibacter termitis TaxID=263852 RepID=A0A1T4M0W5_9ENTE|nr:BglG family transcription antiterminator [Pilibacter termitis]SJZ60364.1 Transcriptional antiterminator [Pilibacter termitis]